jgi:hypothetical protein
MACPTGVYFVSSMRSVGLADCRMGAWRYSQGVPYAKNRLTERARLRTLGHRPASPVCALPPGAPPSILCYY